MMSPEPEIFAPWLELWKPQETQQLSEWAEQHFVLSSRYSSRTGPIRLHGWQREIFDSFTDPRVETTVLMCGTQLTKTIFIQAALAFVISEQPGPVLIVQPAEKDAKAFSVERLAPMVRDCPVLHGLVADSRSRDSSNTILEKEFPGGSVALVGSISPGNLARRSIRYLFCDEPDKYPASAGSEGDPIYLARQRTVTFGSRRKIILACSPTIAGRSRIGKAYAASDERKPWVACPHPECGEFQVLRFFDGVKWDKTLPPEKQAESAYYQCQHCKGRWNDAQRWAACEKAEWRSGKPFAGTAGFWISHLYSPWEKLSDLVDKFLKAKDDPQQLKAFVTTDLAELWEDDGETPESELLFARRENYPFGDDAVVPQRGLFLTAQVDVQDNPPRLEAEVVAWGRDRENWSVDYRIIQDIAENGQPLPVTSPSLWEKLNAEVLQREYRHASGHLMPIMLMAIDTGSKAATVYEFVKKHPQPSHGPAGTRVFTPRSVVAVKGRDDPERVICSVSKEDAARKRQNVRIYGVGTHRVKGEIYDMLRYVRPRGDGAASPACYHFPMYDRSYFDGLCSERRVVKANGKIKWQKLPNVRNEPLDLKVYGRAAATICGIDIFNERQWKAMEDALGMPVVSVVPESPRDEKTENPVHAGGTQRQWRDEGRSDDWYETRTKEWF